jgi:hypothetical protein
VLAVILPNLISAVVFFVEPRLFYFRAWEYMSDIVYRVEGAGLEWNGAEAGDLSRASFFSAQESWVTHVSVDELGFRRVPIRAEQYPVAVAGDSSIFGSGLSDDETLPWVLAEKLGAPVFNGGRTSFDNMLKHPALREVRLVIDMRGEEAIRSHFTPLEPDRAFQPLRDVQGSLLFAVPPERFLPAPWLMRMGNRMLRDLFGMNRGDGRGAGWVFSRCHHDPKHLDAVVAAAVALAEQVRALGIEYAFVAVPNKQNIYGRDYGVAVDDYTLNFTGTLAAALRARGIPSADLGAPLRAARDEGVYFRTDTHWTPRGVQVAADEMVAQLDLPALLATELAANPNGRKHLGDP